MLNLFKKKKIIESGGCIYKTDIDPTGLRELQDKARKENLTIVYHNTKNIPSPTLTSIVNGSEFRKYNPEFIKYIKEKYHLSNEPEIYEIVKLIEERKNEEPKKTLLNFLMK